MASYGLAVLGFTRVVGPLSARWSTPILLGIGGSAGTLGFSVLALQRGVAAGLVACVLLGAAWAFLHSTLQTWATSVAPEARAQIVSLFAGLLFFGGATGVALGGGLAADAAYGRLFGAATAVFVGLTAAAVLARHRYIRSHPGP